MEENTGWLYQEKDPRTLHFCALSFKTISVDSKLIQHAITAFRRHPQLNNIDSYYWATIKQEFLDALERPLIDYNVDDTAMGSMKVECDLPDGLSEHVSPRQIDLKLTADERNLSFQFSIAGQNCIPSATVTEDVPYSRVRRSLAKYQKSLVDPSGFYQSFKTSDQRWFFHLETAEKMFSSPISPVLGTGLHYIAGMNMGINMLKDFMSCVGVLFPTGPAEDWQENLLPLPDFLSNQNNDGYIRFVPRQG